MDRLASASASATVSNAVVKYRWASDTLLALPAALIELAKARARSQMWEEEILLLLERTCQAGVIPSQLLYSLLGVGQTDGEGIERAWADIGGVSTSTREMTPGKSGTLLHNSAAAPSPLDHRYLTSANGPQVRFTASARIQRGEVYSNFSHILFHIPKAHLLASYDITCCCWGQHRVEEGERRDRIAAQPRVVARCPACPDVTENFLPDSWTEGKDCSLALPLRAKLNAEELRRKARERMARRRQMMRQSHEAQADYQAKAREHSAHFRAEHGPELRLKARQRRAKASIAKIGYDAWFEKYRERNPIHPDTGAEPEAEPEAEAHHDPEPERIQRVRDRFIDHQEKINHWLDNCDPTTAPDYIPKPGERPYFQRGKRRWN
ncbi:hypothetical protein C8R47DRAFT_1205035 [Mycena vitilis]|nr:hypothetical protein C8R47DRAFT_1205035 [Mycena vitilis]